MSFICFETRVRKITQLSTSVSPVFLHIMFFVFDVVYLCFETRVRNINATKYLSVPCVSAYYLLHLSRFGSLCFETRVRNINATKYVCVPCVSAYYCHVLTINVSNEHLFFYD